MGKYRAENLNYLKTEAPKVLVRCAINLLGQRFMEKAVDKMSPKHMENLMVKTAYFAQAVPNNVVTNCDDVCKNLIGRRHFLKKLENKVSVKKFMRYVDCYRNRIEDYCQYSQNQRAFIANYFEEDRERGASAFFHIVPDTAFAHITRNLAMINKNAVLMDQFRDVSKFETFDCMDFLAKRYKSADYLNSALENAKKKCLNTLVMPSEETPKYTRDVPAKKPKRRRTIRPTILPGSIPDDVGPYR